MEIKTVVAELHKMALQAQEISDSFTTVGTWYSVVRKDARYLEDDLKKIIKDEDDRIQAIKDKIDAENKKIEEQNKELEAERQKIKEMQEPENFWGWLKRTVIIIFTGGWGLMIQAQIAARKLKLIGLNYQLGTMSDISKSKEAKAAILLFIQALENLAGFCSSMSGKFDTLSAQFKSRAETWENHSHNLDADWMSWSGEEVVEWVKSLHQGQFAEYADAFVSTKGSELPSLNALMIQKFIAPDMPGDLVKALYTDIVLMTDESKKRLIYDNYSFHTTLKWLNETQEEMENIEITARKVVRDDGIQDVKVEPHARKKIVLTQFGKEITIDAVDLVNRYLFEK